MALGGVLMVKTGDAVEVIRDVATLPLPYAMCTMPCVAAVIWDFFSVGLSAIQIQIVSHTGIRWMSTLFLPPRSAIST